MQNLGHTSARNISSALSSITAGYNSAQPRIQQPQLASHPQLQNPPPSGAYPGEAYYSNANYTSAKSPKSTVSSKQTFFKMPDTKERLEAKARLTGGFGNNEGTGLKKFASPNIAISKFPQSNMPTGSKGVRQ